MISSEKSKSATSTRPGCANCKKKQLYSIKCRCEQNLCAICRYPESHKCTYDYVAAGKAELSKNNPAITSNKLDKV